MLRSLAGCREREPQIKEGLKRCLFESKCLAFLYGRRINQKKGKTQRRDWRTPLIVQKKNYNLCNSVFRNHFCAVKFIRPSEIFKSGKISELRRRCAVPGPIFGIWRPGTCFKVTSTFARSCTGQAGSQWYHHPQLIPKPKIQCGLLRYKPPQVNQTRHGHIFHHWRRSDEMQIKSHVTS